MEHSNGAGMPFPMAPPRCELPQANDEAALKLLEEMFEQKSMTLQRICSEELLKGLASVRGSMECALQMAAQNNSERFETLQLEISNELQILKREIFLHIQEEFRSFKSFINELKSGFPAVGKTVAENDHAVSKPVNKVTATVNPSCSAVARSATPVEPLEEMETHTLSSSDDDDDDEGATFSDIEKSVFGKTLITAKRAVDTHETSDPDSDFAPPSKAGRKRGSKNKGKTKKELQEELEKLRRERRVLSTKVAAKEPSLRKSSRI